MEREAISLGVVRESSMRKSSIFRGFSAFSARGSHIMRGLRLTTAAGLRILRDMKGNFMKHRMSFAMVVFAALGYIALAHAAEGEKKERKKYDAPPAMKIDVNKKYSATIDTDKGKIVVELFAKDAPKTV